VPAQDGSPRYGAKDLADFYRGTGGSIFSRSALQRFTSLDGWADEKYDHRPLNKVLQEYLGEDLPMRSAIKPVMVSTYDLYNRKPRFLKSFNPEHFTLPMWMAARATSAAPTYFEPAELPIDSGSAVLVDGGVFVNNPAASAYAEAMRGWHGEEVLVVSVGTGSETGSYNFAQAQHWGKVEWIQPLIHIVFDGVSDAVDYQMEHMLGKRYVRLQIPLRSANADLGDASPDNLAKLESEAERLLAAYQPEIDTLCKLLAPPLAIPV
jgi:patatin-like phospholipase/acyl hydrolase